MSISTDLEWTVVGFAAVVAVALTINSVPSLQAAPSGSPVAAQPFPASQGAMIDRSRKGDRLAPTVPAVKIVLPRGCESQVSPMSQLVPAHLISRCMT
jgi:hypothetical protein